MIKKLSIIVVLYNMRREAPRTLYSLSSAYQEGVAARDYEVIVIDNGSTKPLEKKVVKKFGNNFKYYYNKKSDRSPAKALNYGIRVARSRYLGLMIDGARIASPGLIRFALAGLSFTNRPVVSTLAWHLGPDLQNRSIKEGYNQICEDELLKKIDWQNNGYDLFTISTLAASSSNGFFLPISESNLVFMTKRMVKELNGFDDAFDMPGGGLVNLDFYKRACELPGAELITLLGEGTFHQVHGGIACNRTDESYIVEANRQYSLLRGSEYRSPMNKGIVLGHVPVQIKMILIKSTELMWENSRK